MRIAFVVLAGLIGWLWFAARAPATPAPAPAKLARRADLGNLHAQVAAATGREATISPGGNSDGSMDESAEDVDAEASDDERTADLAGLAAQLAEAEARDVEDPTDVPTDDDTIGHEIIQIEGAAPIIDPTSTTHCFTIERTYTVNIPVPGRTFESVLGAAADSQGQDEGITISSGAQIENTYIIDDEMEKDLDPDSIVY